MHPSALCQPQHLQQLHTPGLFSYSQCELDVADKPSEALPPIHKSPATDGM